MRALTREERAQIEDVIAQLREKSGVDCHVMVMPISDRYALYPLLSSALGALIIAAIVSLVRPALDSRIIIVTQIAALIVLSLVFDWKPLRLALTPMRIRQAHARQLAHRSFAARVEAASDDRGVMLLFVSVAEHYVELIADHATHARLGGGASDRIVAQLTASARRGAIGSGLLTALDALKNALGDPVASAQG